MQNSNLHHIQYTPLDAMTWCATAQVISQSNSSLWTQLLQPLAPNTSLSYPIELRAFYWQYHTPQTSLSAINNAANKRQQQRNGVRLLLRNLLTKVGISDTLDDAQFPYRLVNSRHYVCFSHSGNSRLNDRVAVVISSQRAVGIDIETQDIAWHAAQRFYHPTEIDILAKLSVTEQARISKLLWQIKESFIKVYQYKLAQGLGMDYSYLIADLIVPIKKEQLATVIDDGITEYQIAILPLHETVIIF